MSVKLHFLVFSSLAKVNTFQRKMAAVGAPGPEISDEPHIPSVTIVHRYFSQSQEYLDITGVDDSMMERTTSGQKRDITYVVKYLFVQNWVDICIRDALYPWWHHPISL